ncbi:MAG: hypothetical protein HC835_08435 [Oscillatoriales cyanobacterium RM2_1_1]|nr:hypothetical protein [Oscillatoriales cyanobacterium RM2_1_1]
MRFGLELTQEVLLFLLYSIPIIAVIWFIAYFGIDVPVADQWVLPELFEKVTARTLKFSDLVELHNTHRIVFPRFILISLGFLSSWNIKVEMIVSLGLVSLTFLVLYRLAVNTSIKPSDWLFHLTNGLTCVLIFSLYQSWLWGFQLAIFWINLWVVLACLILISSPGLKPQSSHNYTTFLTLLKYGSGWRDVSPTAKSVPPGIENRCKYRCTYKLINAGICCFIASFSSAQGLLSWLATIPCVIVLSHRNLPKAFPRNLIQLWKPLTIWLLLFLVCCGLYITGYIQESKPESNLSRLAYLSTAAQFFLNLWAAPLTDSPDWGWILGLIIILNFLALMADVCWVRQVPASSIRHQSFEQGMPWVSIGLFSVLTNGLTTLGRTDLGGDYPLYAMRYTTHTLLLFIAILQLWRVWIEQKQFTSKPGAFQNSRLVYGFFSGILVCLIGLRTGGAIAAAQDDLSTLHRSQTCLEVFDYLENSIFFNQSPDRCLLRLSKSTWWIQDGVNSLQNAGLRYFAENITFVSNPTQIYGYIDFPADLSQVFSWQSQDSIQLSGWAIFPKKMQQPQLVFFSSGNSKTFFAEADIGQESLDIATFFNSKLYHQSRWSVTFSPSNLGIGENIIKAWIYDPSQQQFLQLKGELKLDIRQFDFR